MTKTVHRFPLSLTDDGTTKVATAQLPISAQIVHAGPSRGDLVVWAIVERDEPTAERKFYLVNSGDDLPENAGTHVRTIVSLDTLVVFHLFDAVQ